MSSNSWRRWTALGGVGLISLWLSCADALAVASEQPPKPMSITSRTMTVKNLEQRVVFDQDVTVTSGDMDLSADRVEVILVRPADSDGATPFSGGAGPNLLAEDNIDRIVADGHVKVVQGDKGATAHHAVYQRADQTVVLTGNPETSEEGVRIQGSKITILLDQQRSIVEESRVVIYPDAQGGDTPTPVPPSSDGG